MQIDFSSDYGTQTKRAKETLPALYDSFLTMNTEFKKLPTIYSRTISVFMYKVQSILVPLHFRL